MTRSPPAEASRLPSGEKSTAAAPPVCFPSGRLFSPEKNWAPAGPLPLRARHTASTIAYFGDTDKPSPAGAKGPIYRRGKGGPANRLFLLTFAAAGRGGKRVY